MTATYPGMTISTIVCDKVSKSINIMTKIKSYLGDQCLRGSLPKSGPLDFATKNTFALFCRRMSCDNGLS